MKFELINVEITESDDRANYTCGSIEATIKTPMGELPILEWVNTDGSIERTDSHLHVNQKNDIESLFPVDEDGMSLTPWNKIYDSLQAEANKQTA